MLKPQCECNSTPKCIEKIDQRRRIELWKTHWEQMKDYNAQRAYKYQFLEVTKPSRPQVEASRRKRTVKYYLTQRDGVRIRVCKTFFLTTFGYTKSSSVIDEMLSSTDLGSTAVSLDGRGGRRESHCVNKEEIIAHIESYNPALPHYRRAHAPNRRYLPSELSITEMHKDFNSQQPPCNQVSYTSYQRVISDLNISFAKLSTEECETCRTLEYAHDKNEEGNCVSNCEGCKSQNRHDELKRLAREAYQSDAKEVIAGTVVRSVDLQKVIMLPAMPGIKSVCFTKRIIAFHQTFAPIDAYKREIKTTSVVWHEAVAGRLGCEIASTYLMALNIDRDYSNVIYFMDNCTAQNKNWTLFTAMVDIINSNRIAANKITFKYLEAGHTFMSADSIHHEVEQKMRKKKNVMDFNDFMDCVDGKKVRIVAPACTDFKNLTGEESQPKLSRRPCLIADMRVVEFRRGQKSLFVKQNHNDAEFTEFDFLKKKFKPGSAIIPPLRTSDRGIPQSKKDDIANKLLPLMPENRRGFWQTLSVSDEPDLLTNGQLV